MSEVSYLLGDYEVVAFELGMAMTNTYLIGKIGQEPAVVIDPAWQGDVTFYELVYGTWLSYAFLVIMWERVLRVSLPEWKYILITFLGAGAFWINHYFQKSPYWSTMLNIYSISFLVIYFLVCARDQPRGLGWKIGAVLSAVVFTVAFIGFENIARYGVNRGVHEFWFMLTAFFGFVAVILWRGPRREA